MLSTYQDFISHNLRYQQLAKDSYFQKVFDFLSEKENIVKMIEVSKWNKPALSGCVIDLEKKFPKLLNQGYNDYFIKQSVGTMIKEILIPFAYIPHKQKRLSSIKSKFFKSAHTYEFKKNLMKLELVKSWEIKKV